MSAAEDVLRKPVKVSDVEGPLLDFLVGRAEKLPVRLWVHPTPIPRPHHVSIATPSGDAPYSPSEDWSVGGPIIEREHIALDTLESPVVARAWNCTASGPKPLVAAMRCYVASKFGDEFVPEEMKS